MSLSEYETVRRDSRHFAVVLGHIFSEIERAVSGNERFDVVEKFGAAVPLADARDPGSAGKTGRRDDDAG